MRKSTVFSDYVPVELRPANKRRTGIALGRNEYVDARALLDVLARGTEDGELSLDLFQLSYSATGAKTRVFVTFFSGKLDALLFHRTVKAANKLMGMAEANNGKASGLAFDLYTDVFGDEYYYSFSYSINHANYIECARRRMFPEFADCGAVPAIGE